jgi:hypothetical protein
MHVLEKGGADANHITYKLQSLYVKALYYSMMSNGLFGFAQVSRGL